MIEGPEPTDKLLDDLLSESKLQQAIDKGFLDQTEYETIPIRDYTTGEVVGQHKRESLRRFDVKGKNMFLLGRQALGKTMHNAMVDKIQSYAGEMYTPTKEDFEKSKRGDIRNSDCYCGSGKKYKKCCMK